MEIIDLQWGQSIFLSHSARVGKYCSLVAAQSGPSDGALLTKPSLLSHTGQRSGSKVKIVTTQSVTETESPPITQVVRQLISIATPTKNEIKSSKDTQLATAKRRADSWASFGWVIVLNEFLNSLSQVRSSIDYVHGRPALQRRRTPLLGY